VSSETLPPSWKRVRLADVAKTSSGGTPSRGRADFYEGSIPWVKSGELRDGVVYETEEKISKEALASSSAKVFPKGTVCIALYGATVGRLGILGTDAATNQAVCGIFPGPAVDPKYLFRFLESRRSDLIEQGKGGAQSNISQAIVREIELPLPPVAEQQRIVAEIEKQFTRLDAGVASTKRVQANLKRYRAVVLQMAAEGQLVEIEAEKSRNHGRDYESGEHLLRRLREGRPDRSRGSASGVYESKSISGLKDLPEGWVWCRLEELCAAELNSITDGPFGSNLKTEHYTTHGARVIRLQNIGDSVFIEGASHISEAHFLRLQRHRIFAGDLVIAAFGSDPPRACIIPQGVGNAVVKADCIRFKPHESIDGRFLNFALNSPTVRRHAKTMVHGVGRPRLNLGEIKSIPIPLAPLAEQQRIVADVERRLSVVHEMEQVVEANLLRARNLRQSILQRAFSGNL
jgi:type I restriction enzyme, S subunit